MRYYQRKIKKFARDEIIFSEDMECDGMYIIDSGQVRIYKTVDTPQGKREVELCRLGVKSMFGEMAMIDENKRSASVQALEPTSCTIITKKIFEDQLSRIPVWMVNMIRILVQRLRETNGKLRTILEEYAPSPNNDMGSVLTIVQEKKESVPMPPPGAKRSALEGRKSSLVVETETIINDLFEKDKNNLKDLLDC
ncbi:MAG: cyclic nucleotide-binding domain-containing protein [Chitinivibrionales bacterium]|nr:cyclic nucleotide-binding domain-containing protein [Chitinivibrionales bacterium]